MSTTAPTTGHDAEVAPPAASEHDVRRVFSMILRIARNPFIPAKPTPHQIAYLVAEERETLFTGSGGNGKSTALLLAALADVDRPGYRGLLIQRTMAGPVSLAERLREWLEPTAASWDSSARVWRFPSGASVDLGHERYAYVSGEYHMIGVDDATLFSLDEYRRIFQTWRRRSGSTTPMRIRVATSPGGPGHDWVRERFAIDNPASVLPLGRRVVFAQMSDNPYLDEAEYRRSLANLDPVRRAQLETGDWSIRQGGAIFQRQWFRIVDRAPAGLRRVRFWDLAATAEPTRTDLLYDPDYTVGALLGLAHDGTVYVLDVIRRRLDSPDVKRLVRQTAELDGREVVIGMEQESGASGKAVIQDYRRSLAGYVFQPRQPFADKVTRAAPYASYTEGGGVRLVRAPWNAAFLQEHEQFPLGEHDDAVDAAGWAFFLLTNRISTANSRDRARAHFNPWATEDTEP